MAFRGIERRLSSLFDHRGLFMPKRWQQCLIGAACATFPMFLSPASSAYAAEPLSIELNTIEPLQEKCRLTFLMANPAPSAVDSLKADTAVFGKDGVIKNRLVIEFGPLKPKKTSIRAFDLDAGCDSLGSLLINDVIACQPEALGDCLARLELSSRTPVKLFK